MRLRTKTDTEATPIELSSVAERQIAAYLDAVEISTAQGAEAQEEWRAEAESHLRSLIAAYEELGDTHEQAVRAALARFGKPATIGFRMRMEMIRQAERKNPETQVTNYILKSCAGFVLPVLAAFIGFILLIDYSDSTAAQALARNITIGLLLLGPLFSGWLLGRRPHWLLAQVQRVRAVHGVRGMRRLAFGLTVAAATVTFELSLFWSLIRTLGEGGPMHVTAPDILPTLGWLPITLAVAYARSRRDRRDTSDKRNPGTLGTA